MCMCVHAKNEIKRVRERFPYRTKYGESEKPTLRSVQAQGPHRGGPSAWHGWLWTVGKPLSARYSPSLNA